MSGTELIAAERKRQIEVEGFDEKHDSIEHGDDCTVLAQAAQAYLTAVIKNGAAGAALWPWDNGFKPKDVVRDLVRAGALVAGAIDAQQRIESVVGAEGATQDE